MKKKKRAWRTWLLVAAAGLFVACCGCALIARAINPTATPQPTRTPAPTAHQRASPADRWRL